MKRLRDHNKHIRQREALKAMLFKLGRRGADSDASRVTLCERVRAACFYLQRRLLTQSLKSVGLFVWQTEQWPDNTGKLDYVRVCVHTTRHSHVVVTVFFGLVVVAMVCVCCVTCQVLLSAPVHVLQRRAQALGVVVPVMPMSSPRYAIALDAKLSGKAPSSALRRGEMKAVFEVCSPCQRPTRMGRVGVTHTCHVRRVASGRGILCVAGPCWNIRSSTPSITSVAARVEAPSGGWPGIKRYHRAMRVCVAATVQVPGVLRPTDCRTKTVCHAGPHQLSQGSDGGQNWSRSRVRHVSVCVVTCAGLTRVARRSGAGLNVTELMAEGIVTVVFPLHDRTDVDWLIKHWVSFGYIEEHVPDVAVELSDSDSSDSEDEAPATPSRMKRFHTGSGRGLRRQPCAACGVLRSLAVGALCCRPCRMVGSACCTFYPGRASAWECWAVGSCAAALDCATYHMCRVLRCLSSAVVFRRSPHVHQQLFRFVCCRHVRARVVCCLGLTVKCTPPPQAQRSRSTLRTCSSTHPTWCRQQRSVRSCGRWRLCDNRWSDFVRVPRSLRVRLHIL